MVQDQQGKGGEVNTTKEEYDENDDPVEAPAEISAEEAAEAFAEDAPPAVVDYESMTEEELRSMLVEAKAEFKKALDAVKADPSEENLAIRSRASKVCSDINQTLIKNGHGIV